MVAQRARNPLESKKAYTMVEMRVEMTAEKMDALTVVLMAAWRVGKRVEWMDQSKAVQWAA